MRRIGDEPGGGAKAEAFVARWINRWERKRCGPVHRRARAQPNRARRANRWDRRTWETSAYDLAAEHAQEELGWALVRSAWGNGYAMEAAQAVKSWCHRDRGIERLVSLIAPDNLRSQRVAEKLGARLEERIQTTVGPTDVWAYHR